MSQKQDGKLRMGGHLKGGIPPLVPVGIIRLNLGDKASHMDMFRVRSQGTLAPTYHLATIKRTYWFKGI